MQEIISNSAQEEKVRSWKKDAHILWMTHSLFLWRTERKCVPYFFLVFVFDGGGGSCFFLQLKCSSFKIPCKFQVYSKVICLYLYMYICFLNIGPSDSSFKFEVISLFKKFITLKLTKRCLLFNLAKLSFRDSSRWALFLETYYELRILSPSVSCGF